MPKTLPEVGDYCRLTDREGGRIGRVVAVNKNIFSIKYHYDAFSGYIIVDRNIDQIAYMEKPIGVNISMDSPEISNNISNKTEPTNVYEARWEMLRDIIDLQSAYNKICTSNQLTKKMICNTVIPFRDKYGLSDQNALNLAKGYYGLEKTIQIISDTYQE